MVECRWRPLFGCGLKLGGAIFRGYFALLGVGKHVTVIIVHHKLADALLGIGCCLFRDEMRESACLLFGSKLVATCLEHLLGEASGSSVGAGAMVDIHGVRVPAAEDLGGVVADASTEESGGSPCAERLSIDKLWWDASAIFAEVCGKAQSRYKLASGNIGPAMLFVGSSWYEVGAEGSVDAFGMHRRLPHVVHE